MATTFSTPSPLIWTPKFIEGLRIAVASDTTLTVTAGYDLDSTDSINMQTGSTITINAAITGKNGIDTGVFEASKVYYVHLISNSRNLTEFPTAAIFSLSKTAPILPAGYDVFRWIGIEFSDSSTHFLKCTNIGNGNFRKKVWDTNIQVLSAGDEISLTEIDLSSAVPPIDNMIVNIDVDFIPATADDRVSFTPFGSTATVLPHVTGNVATKKSSGHLPVVSKLDSITPKILYINSAASCSSTVWVNGFEYFL